MKITFDDLKQLIQEAVREQQVLLEKTPEEEDKEDKKTSVKVPSKAEKVEKGKKEFGRSGKHGGFGDKSKWHSMKKKKSLEEAVPPPVPAAAMKGKKDPSGTELFLKANQEQADTRAMLEKKAKEAGMSYKEYLNLLLQQANPGQPGIKMNEGALKQFVKAVVKRQMMLREYEEIEMIDPETGDLVVRNDEGDQRVIGKADREYDMGMEGYDEWEANGFPQAGRARNRHGW